MSQLKVGDKAPLFALKNQQGDEVSLSSFKGDKNVVVYFYPKAMTPGCTVQACGIRDEQDAFANEDVVVLGISPDPVPRLAKFREKHDLNFDLLSDEDHAIAEKFGVWDLKKFMGKEYMGIVRTTFIVDKKGKLAYVMDKVKTKTHHDDILSVIREQLN